MKRFITILLISLFALPCWAVDMWVDVDAAVTVPVNHIALSTDGTDIDAGVTYNEAGMVLVWNFLTTAGVQTQTAADPCNTGGDYDWVIVGNGMYNIEIPASGGADFNNDTEGFGWFSGITTATLPWSGPRIGFRAAVKNNLEIDDGTAQANQSDMYDGTGYAGGTINLNSDAVKISGDATTADNQQVFFGNGTTFGLFADYYDGTTVSVASVFSDAITLSTLGDKVVADMDANSLIADGTVGLAVIEGQTDDIGVAGAGLTNINLPNQTMDVIGTLTGNIIGDVTGNVDGSVGSLTGHTNQTGDNFALLGTAVALDGGAATIGGMLTKMADDNGGADFDAGTDSLQEIRDRGDAGWTTGGSSSLALNTTIASATSASSVTLTAGTPVINAYRFMILTVTDADDNTSIESRVITQWSAGRVAVLGEPYSFTPANGDTATISPIGYFKPTLIP